MLQLAQGYHESRPYQRLCTQAPDDDIHNKHQKRNCDPHCFETTQQAAHDSGAGDEYVQVKLGFMQWGQGTNAQWHRMCQHTRQEYCTGMRHLANRTRIGT